MPDQGEYDRDIARSAKIAALKQEACGNKPMRELTVGELFDQRIEKFERIVRALHDLKGSLPLNFLNSGASRIGALLEPLS